MLVTMSMLKEFFQSRLMELGKNIEKYKILHLIDDKCCNKCRKKYTPVYVDMIYCTNDKCVINGLKKLYFEMVDFMLESELRGTLNYLDENVIMRLGMMNSVFKLERENGYKTTLRVGIAELEHNVSFLFNVNDEIGKHINEINSRINELSKIIYSVTSKYMALNTMVQELRKKIRERYKTARDADKMDVTENLIRSRSSGKGNILITDIELNILEVNNVFSRVKIDENVNGAQCMIRDGNLFPIAKIRIESSVLDEIFEKRVVSHDLLNT